MPTNLKIYLPFLLACFAIAGCSDSIGAACAKGAECEERECEYTGAACKELARGNEESCSADLHAFRDAIATGDGSTCDNCVKAMDELYDCLASVDSCAAFEGADSEDGECRSEFESMVEDCEDVEARCLE